MLLEVSRTNIKSKPALYFLRNDRARASTWGHEIFVPEQVVCIRESTKPSRRNCMVSLIGGKTL